MACRSARVGGTVVRSRVSGRCRVQALGHGWSGALQEGYAGVEGNDMPYTFVITVDGAEVYSAPVGGPKDHEDPGAAI